MAFPDCEPSVPRLITEDHARSIRRVINERYGIRLTRIRTEIKDDDRLLLVNLAMDASMPVGDVIRTLDLISSQMSRRVPKREDGYSWTVNIHVHDELARTASGGWLGRQDA